MNPLASWFHRTMAGTALQGRLARLTSLGVAMAVLFIGLATYYAARATMYSELDQELIEVASYASPLVGIEVDGLGGLNASSLQAANVSLMLVSTKGDVLRVPGMRETIDPGVEEIAIARTQQGSSTRTLTSRDGSHYRVVAVPATIDSGKYAMVIGRSLGPTTTTLWVMGNVIVVIGAIFILLSGAMGSWSGQRLTRPLRDLSTALTRVTETNELQPIGVYTDDELGELSRSFDTMMHSLDSSRERQKRLIADAGHELRTPLTSMRTNVELLVADEKSGMLPEGARSEILNDVAAQLGEFTSLVGDLVQLSRDDVVTPAPEPLDFADVVRSTIERAKRRGPHLGFDVRLRPHFIIGEPDTLERAVTNLLDNAVKFSPDAGTVHVRLIDGTLTIWDEGPGIAEEDLERIFDRFYRSDKARNTPGTGLGLSIVDHTIRSHGGDLGARNHPGAGAEFWVTLPAADPEDLTD